VTTEDTFSHEQLSAAEISSLWTVYQANTVDMCGISFFLVHVKDPEIQQIIEKTLDITTDVKEQMEQIFRYEDYPVPQAFSEKDVNYNAPKLFSDELYLEYILNMSDLNLIAYSSALTMAARPDIIEFYSKNLEITKKLHNEIIELVKQKGIYVWVPTIPKANKIKFVEKESFLTGWFGDRRPLLGVEIANLAYASKRNAIGQALITGFSQVAESKEVRKYLEKGRDISGKHKDVFNEILNQDYLSGGLLKTSEVTNSTEAPFSDKLMMNLVTTLIASGIAQYGTAISASPRHDLGVQYTRLMAEIAKYANEGANILIENGWMEQPPIAADRKNLAQR